MVLASVSPYNPETKEHVMDGGVKIAFSKDEVEKYSSHILGNLLVTIQTGDEGKVVNNLYIESGCEIEYEYNVGDKKYTKNTNMEKYKRYRDGDKVKIFYDPSNPDDNEVDGINQNMLGFGLIGGGFFIVMIATVGYLIATKIKGGGTALTAMTALSALRR